MIQTVTFGNRNEFVAGHEYFIVDFRDQNWKCLGKLYADYWYMVWVFSDIGANRIIGLKLLCVGEESYKLCRTRRSNLLPQ